jgi:ribosomal protein S27AE
MNEHQTAKTCPDCGPTTRLVVANDLPLLVGLSDFEAGAKKLMCPTCGYDESLPPDLEMRDAGAVMLPGLEEV